MKLFFMSVAIIRFLYLYVAVHVCMAHVVQREWKNSKFHPKTKLIKILKINPLAMQPLADLENSVSPGTHIPKPSIQQTFLNT